MWVTLPTKLGGSEHFLTQQSESIVGINCLVRDNRLTGGEESKDVEERMGSGRTRPQ